MCFYGQPSQEDEFFLHGYTMDIFFQTLSPFPYMYIKTLLAMEVSDHVLKKNLTRVNNLKLNDVNFLIYKDHSW